MKLLSLFSQRLYLRIWLAVVGGVAVLTLTVAWAWQIAAEQNAQNVQSASSPPSRDVAMRDADGKVIAQGRARLDAVKLGLDLDAEGRVLHADGAPDARLLVLGPPARAAFWETIAVPDIRKRIEAMVRTLGQPLDGAI